MEQDKKLKVVDSASLNENRESVAEISPKTTTDFTLQMKTVKAPQALDVIQSRQAAIQKITLIPESINETEEGDVSK